MVRNNGYCIMPFANLAADIGVLGANHSHKILSPLSKIQVDSDSFPWRGELAAIVPTEFDKYFFLHNRFIGLLRRKFSKYLHL